MTETSPYRLPPEDDRARPNDLDLDLGNQKLTIAWSDGQQSEFTATELRRYCPCALCRTEREKQQRTLLPILTREQAATATITGGHLAGHYAIELEWSDGHNAGIYDFRLLRALHDEHKKQ